MLNTSASCCFVNWMVYIHLSMEYKLLIIIKNKPFFIIWIYLITNTSKSYIAYNSDFTKEHIWYYGQRKCTSQ